MTDHTATDNTAEVVITGTAAAEFLSTARNWNGDDHDFIERCLYGEYGARVQEYAEHAIATTPIASFGENDCRAIADHIIDTAHAHAETHPPEPPGQPTGEPPMNATDTRITQARDQLLANLTVTTDRDQTCYHGEHHGADGHYLRLCVYPHDGGRAEIHRFTNGGMTWQIHLDGTTPTTVTHTTLDATLATIPPTLD